MLRALWFRFRWWCGFVRNFGVPRRIGKYRRG